MSGSSLKQSLTPLVGDLRQLASIRPVVLDEGQEAGVRALLFSSGGGLDCMILVGRALDIGTLSYRGVPLSWQSPSGFVHPALIDRDAEGGTGMGRGFSGFMITTGLDHIRQPDGGHPLHGRFPFTPARLCAYGQDWDRPEPVLFCEGEIVQSRRGQETLLLRRRIEMPIGGTTIRIHDSVENCGLTESPHELLYHLNFGYPAITAGTRVLLDGAGIASIARLPDMDADLEAKCHRVITRPRSRCRLLTPAQKGELAIDLDFSSDTLPFLQIWRDLRPRAGILAVEPCTAERLSGGGSIASALLAVGTRRDYNFSLCINGEVPIWTSPDVLSSPDSAEAGGR